MLFTLLKAFCFPNPSYVATFYLLYSTILSIVFTYVQLPDSYFNQSDNDLNVFFMKYSYFYTAFFLLPFACVLHYVLNYGSCKKSLFAFLRVFLFVFINYCIGEEFNILGFFFGACNMYSYYIDDKVECISKGYQWTKLDISGHVFHILYSILVVLEELYFVRNWQSIKNKVYERFLDTGDDDDDDDDSYDENPITEISRKRFNVFLKLFIRNRCFLKTCIIFLIVLMILLHLSIFFTLIYFHTAFEKIVATIIALIFWFVTYHVIYPISGFKTGPYSIETAEHESLLESEAFSLIYGDNIDEQYKNKSKIYKFFVSHPKHEPYELLN